MNTSSSILLTCVLLLAVGTTVLDWNPPRRASQPPETVMETAVVPPRAPEGTLYLTQYVSARTRKGVYGFEPGCPLRLLGVNPAKQTLRVTDGKQSVEIDPSLLTDDPEVADAARRADQVAQRAAAAAQQRQREDDEAANREIYIAQARDARAAEIDHNLRAGIYSRGGRLDEPAQPTGWNGNPYGWTYGDNPLDQPAEYVGGYYNYGYPYAYSR